MNLRSRIFSLAVGAALLATSAIGAAAQSSTTSSVTIGGGNFTASVSSSNFASLPYSFTDQTARNATITVTVTDQTGDEEGWTVTLTSTAFIGNLRPAESIPIANFVFTGFTITVAADGSQPVSLPNMSPVDGGDLSLNWTANPGYGQGSYNLIMTGDLIVPGLTSAQTYTSTGTLAIVSGP